MTPDLLADTNITAARAGLLTPLERDGKRKKAGMESCERNLDLRVRGWETEAMMSPYLPEVHRGAVASWSSLSSKGC